MVSHGFRETPTLNRLNKEVCILNENYYTCSLLINNNCIDIYIPLYIINCTKIMVNVSIDESYPFKVPNVFINNIKYSKLLQLISIKLNCDDMCLCCKSITCPNKWKPAFKISDILSEIFEYQHDIINFLPAGVCD